jgi:hypothetical protein
MDYQTILTGDILQKYWNNPTLVRSFRSDFQLLKVLIIAYNNLVIHRSYSEIARSGKISAARVGQIVGIYKFEVEPLIKVMEKGEGVKQ